MSIGAGITTGNGEAAGKTLFAHRICHPYTTSSMRKEHVR
jgi:hypothetical protein